MKAVSSNKVKDIITKIENKLINTLGTTLEDATNDDI